MDTIKFINAYQDGRIEAAVKDYSPVEGKYKPTGNTKAFSGLKIIGYPANILKAWYVATKGVEWLGTQKVSAFYQGLAGVRNPQVTIDVHMYNACMGTDFRAGNCPKIRPADYKAMADAVRAVAKEMNYYPLDMQAIIWEHMRRREKNRGK